MNFYNTGEFLSEFARRRTVGTRVNAIKGSGRYRIRTCDPRRVKAMLYH